ncbi:MULTISPECIES: methyltransferase domain-containing protein [Ureibacillus]|uniref:methyltransferase domain-containing protein n=1 Tax=Ureibacillus TaxID=160795 RepID=UPI002F94F1CC
MRDITKLDYHNEFDTLFSNATLHWINEPEKALTNIFKSLKKEEDLSLSLVGKVMSK